MQSRAGRTLLCVTILLLLTCSNFTHDPALAAESSSAAATDEPKSDASAPENAASAEDQSACVICLPRTKPKLRKRGMQKYPLRENADNGEGWVLLSMTVGADGSTRDIFVVDSVGSPSFQKVAIDAVRDWKYDPALESGKPVDTNDYTIKIVFRFPPGFEGSSHSAASTGYSNAFSLMKEERFTEAVTLLNETIQTPRINLYEETMLEFLLAQSYSRLNRIQDAVLHARRATVSHGAFLDKRVRASAFRHLISAELDAGNLVEAKYAAVILAQIEPNLQPDDPALTRRADLETSFDAQENIGIAGELIAPVPGATTGQWSHILLRRTLAFSHIAGTFTSVRLSCTGRALQLTMTTETQWTIQKSAGDCMLYVRGAPGSTFTLVESR